jgi:hypothetical protein
LRVIFINIVVAQPVARLAVIAVAAHYMTSIIRLRLINRCSFGTILDLRQKPVELAAIDLQIRAQHAAQTHRLQVLVVYVERLPDAHHDSYRRNAARWDDDDQRR